MTDREQIAMEKLMQALTARELRIDLAMSLNFGAGRATSVETARICTKRDGRWAKATVPLLLPNNVEVPLLVQRAELLHNLAGMLESTVTGPDQR